MLKGFRAWPQLHTALAASVIYIGIWTIAGATWGFFGSKMHVGLIVALVLATIMLPGITWSALKDVYVIQRKIKTGLEEPVSTTRRVSVYR